MRRVRSAKRSVAMWLPNWPIQRLQSDEPALRARAVVLYESVRGGRKVCAVSSQAAERGVRLGMPVAEATSLVDRRQIYVAPHDAVADRMALETLAGWCERFSPQVALDAEEKPQGLFLDVTGLAPLFGGEGALVRQVVRDFSRDGWHVRVALADTAGAAWAVVHYGGHGSGGADCYRQRHEASSPVRRWEVPVIVPADAGLATLSSLPVAALRISSATIERLACLGIATIGQVAQLPRAGLSSRFDEELLRRLDQAMGRRDEVTRAEHVAEPLMAERRLECSTAHRDVVEHVWGTLVDEVCEKLIQRGEGALRLECSLETDAGETLLLSVGTYRPVAEARHLKDLVRLQWERQPLGEAVWKIEVAVAVSARLERRQQSLFADGAATPTQAEGPERRELAVLIDRLSSRLGREAVLTISLTGDAVPEYGYRSRPVSDRGLRRASSKRASPKRGAPKMAASDQSVASQTSSNRKRRPPGLRPLWLERRPVRLSVVTALVGSAGPEGPEGLPARFRYGAAEHVVSRCWGPERIETGWWRGASVRRDYYRVETTEDLRFWLFRCRRQNQWFLHGMFD